MTGDARAGWIAGLLYGFALYRVPHAPHLQVLHAQWAPLVLYGLHRYFAHGRWRAAVGAGLALAAQNLSNGYYLFYLALLLPPYVIVQILVRRRVADWRAWAGPALAAAIAAVITVPMMYPYLQLRAQGGGVRPLGVVASYGADTQAWFTAGETLRLWGWLRPITRPENELFLGLTTMVLAAAGLFLVVSRRVKDGAGESATQDRSQPRRQRAKRVLATLAATSLAWHTLAIGLALFARISRFAVGPLVVTFGNGRRLIVLWACSLVLLLACSRRARRVLRESPHAPVMTLAALVILTVWLSFGPFVRIAGLQALSWPAPYALLHALVPGADALRVPPRIAMMTALLTAMLGGIAVWAWRQRHRVPDAAIAALSVLVLAEAWVAPIPMNVDLDPGPAFVRTPATVAARPARDPEAAAIAGLPPDAVIVELPFGILPYEIRWQYLAAGHWRPRVNGYSGGFPDDYSRVEYVLRSLPDSADEAEALLRARSVTHVVLRPAVWRDPAVPEAIGAWLSSIGAVVIDTPAASLEVWALPQ